MRSHVRGCQFRVSSLKFRETVSRNSPLKLKLLERNVVVLDRRGDVFGHRVARGVFRGLLLRSGTALTAVEVSRRALSLLAGSVTTAAAATATAGFAGVFAAA